MALSPEESAELEFIQVLKSKHARYIDGKRVIDADAVSGDYVPPGGIFGEVDNSGQYAPVTRDTVDTGGTDAANNVIPLANLNENDWHNWQVDDVIAVQTTRGSTDETATITNIDETAGELTVDALSDDYTEGTWIVKDDGAGTAEFICLELVDLTEGDAIVGGITHGAVYVDRLPYFDSLVEEDLNMIAFEE